MRIFVRYFAVVRERTGQESEWLDCAEPAVAGELLQLICDRYPTLEPLRTRIRVAVNESFVDLSHPVGSGDEIALIPPVAGGSAPAIRRLSAEPIDLNSVIAAVTGRKIGGIVTFTGLVREESRGKTITRLEYEAYPEMAEKVLANLISEVEAAISGARVEVRHRTGVLLVGDVAVVIAAGAAHRAEAFEACRMMIERLKQEVPIWKHEFDDQGGHWVGSGP